MGGGKGIKPARGSYDSTPPAALMPRWTLPRCVKEQGVCMCVHTADRIEEKQGRKHALPQSMCKVWFLEKGQEAGGFQECRLQGKGVRQHTIFF